MSESENNKKTDELRKKLAQLSHEKEASKRALASFKAALATEKKISEDKLHRPISSR